MWFTLAPMASQNSKIPIQTSVCAMCWISSVSTTQPTGHKGSATTAWCQTWKDSPRGPVSMPQRMRAKTNPWLGPRIKIFPGHLEGARSRWDRWNTEARGMSWTACHVPRVIPWEVFCHTVRCPAGLAAASGECCCLPSEGILVPATQTPMKTVSVPHECRDPRFLSRTFELNEMKIVFQFACQWF